MSKHNAGEPMRYGSGGVAVVPAAPIGFDTKHCWAVKGTGWRGEAFMMRFIPGSFPWVKTLDDAKTAAIDRVRIINNGGGKVQAVKQHLDINELWQDC